MKRKVLLVEDDESSRDIIKYLLKESFDLVITFRGEDAIALAKQKQFDLILMDIKLNYGMNGIQATKEIRKINGYENCPIIAITAYAMRGDEEYFLSQGMSKYISKPFDFKDFLNTINTTFTSNN